MSPSLLLFLFAGAILVFLFVVLPISWARSALRKKEQRLETARLFAQHMDGGVFPVDVRVVPLPACILNLIPRIVGIVLMELYFGVFLIGVVFNRQLTGADNQWIFFIVGGVVVAVGILVPVLVGRAILRARTFLTPELRDHPEAPLLEALTKARMPGRASQGRRAKMAWPRLTGMLDPAHRPRTVVDKLFLMAVEDIEVVGELREPTPIVGGPVRTSRDGNSLLIILAIALLACAAAQFYWLVAIIGSGIVYLLLTTPWIRNLVPGLRLESRAMLAGPGFICKRNGIAWRCDEGLLIVRTATAKRRATHPIQAQFIGPAGLATIEFSSSRDEDFRTLWANWNSTDPRPELAEAPI